MGLHRTLAPFQWVVRSSRYPVGVTLGDPGRLTEIPTIHDRSVPPDTPSAIPLRTQVVSYTSDRRTIYLVYLLVSRRITSLPGFRSLLLKSSTLTPQITLLPLRWLNRPYLDLVLVFPLRRPRKTFMDPIPESTPTNSGQSVPPTPRHSATSTLLMTRVTGVNMRVRAPRIPLNQHTIM